MFETTTQVSLFGYLDETLLRMATLSATKSEFTGKEFFPFGVKMRLKQSNL